MAQKNKKEAGNKSRIVVEGLDKPVPRPKYHDRVKIDPFTKRFHSRSKRRGETRT